MAIFPQSRGREVKLYAGTAICHHPQEALKGILCSLALPSGSALLSRAFLAAPLLRFGLEHLQPCADLLKEID